MAVSMRVGLVGAGFMGSTHWNAWRNVPGAIVAGVYSPSRRSAIHDGRWYASLADLLTDRAIDAVDLCLPTDLHHDVAIQVLAAGKHVLVEKPMALRRDDAERMIAAAKSAGKVLMAAQVVRFMPAYMALDSAVTKGSIGPVLGAMFRRRSAFPQWGNWLADKSRSGGGVFDLLIHDVDFMLHLFGRPDAVSAAGCEDLDAGVDLITATFHYAGSTPVVITGGWHNKSSYPFSMEFTVTGRDATIEYHSTRGPGVGLYAPGETREIQTKDVDAYECELRYFAQCCEAGEQPTLCPPEESAEAVELTQLMIEARTSGEKLSCRS